MSLWLQFPAHGCSGEGSFEKELAEKDGYARIGPPA